jgi:hypothetical protein
MLKRIKSEKEKKTYLSRKLPFSAPSFSGISVFGRDPACHDPSLPLTVARAPPVSFFLLPRLSPSEPSRIGISDSRPSKTLEPFPNAPQLPSPLLPLISARDRASFG